MPDQSSKEEHNPHTPLSDYNFPKPTPFMPPWPGGLSFPDLRVVLKDPSVRTLGPLTQNENKTSKDSSDDLKVQPKHLSMLGVAGQMRSLKADLKAEKAIKNNGPRFQRLQQYYQKINSLMRHAFKEAPGSTSAWMVSTIIKAFNLSYVFPKFIVSISPSIGEYFKGTLSLSQLSGAMGFGVMGFFAVNHISGLVQALSLNLLKNRLKRSLQLEAFGNPQNFASSRKGATQNAFERANSNIAVFDFLQAGLEGSAGVCVGLGMVYSYSPLAAGTLLFGYTASLFIERQKGKVSEMAETKTAEYRDEFTRILKQLPTDLIVLARNQNSSAKGNLRLEEALTREADAKVRYIVYKSLLNFLAVGVQSSAVAGSLYFCLQNISQLASHGASGSESIASKLLSFLIAGAGQLTSLVLALGSAYGALRHGSHKPWTPGELATIEKTTVTLPDGDIELSRGTFYVLSGLGSSGKTAFLSALNPSGPNIEEKIFGALPQTAYLNGSNEWFRYNEDEAKKLPDVIFISKLFFGDYIPELFFFDRTRSLEAIEDMLKQNLITEEALLLLCESSPLLKGILLKVVRSDRGDPSDSEARLFQLLCMLVKYPTAVFLFDGGFGDLDQKIREEIGILFADLTSKNQYFIVVATNSVDLIKHSNDQLFARSNNDIKFVSFTNPEISNL